ncbi:MAG TPA: 6,7-dimethyl-8-ribityllumazine synthase [Bacteroidia bacterium]|nr:6,7-dimethyl-8-ribityllumazine synthase [Bacteroidia bacterium]
MATALKNLSQHDPEKVPSGKGKKIAVVVSEWNSEVTFGLLEGAVATLIKYGVKKKDIAVSYVPGAFELTLGCLRAGSPGKINAVIAIGCVVRGDTPHFEFICQGVTTGITQLNISLAKPVIFGVLTTNTLQQALERSGGKHGNKGVEAAVTALKMCGKQN